MDIGAGKSYPSNSLSNFAPHPFELDGVKISSMEGFLQSLKFESIEMQAYICTLVGKKAKFSGKSKNWYVKQVLYWKGVPYNREGEEYQNLLDRAYTAMYEQSEGFRKALIASQNSTLKHSIGRSDKSRTVLTVQEFVRRLTKLRDKGIL